MSEGYNKIFWGFIFITFHINLGSIQVLPNFIGYLIIYFALEKISEEYDMKVFKESAKYCSVLIVMSFLSLLMGFASNIELINNTVFNIIWMNIFNIVELIMIYKLLCGSSEILKIKNNSLSDSYSNKTGIYVILASIVTVANTINNIFVSEGLNVCVVILALSLRIWIILLNREIYKMKVV